MSIYDFAVVGIGFLSIRFRLSFVVSASAESLRGISGRVVVIASLSLLCRSLFLSASLVELYVSSQYSSEILSPGSAYGLCRSKSLLCGRLNENLSDRIPFLCFVIVRASRFAGSLLKPLFVWKIFLVTVCYVKVRLWVRLSQNVSCRIPFLCIGILRTPSLRRSVQRKHCNSFDLFGVCQ